MSLHPDDTLERDREGPRRVALLSDVHANLPALRAVLADIDRTQVDEIWCLGDLVGYGAQPDACVALAEERCHLCLIGNHDLAVLGKLDIRDFSGLAAAAAEWTRGRIGDKSLDFLAELDPEDTSGEIGLFHGSPRNPIWEYVLSVPQAESCMEAMEARVGAVGHSHVALCFWRENGGEAGGRQAPEATEVDLSHGRWLLNPGAVGQPRDGDPRAAWLLLDLDQDTATWKRVDYPIAEAADAIRVAGLPRALSDRLFRGQ
ncbi:MAG: metallophosphoesterase family protein [Thermoleophilaceae bacterium]|jgi:predicted phosphodiesterase|nr:metallophosphoesterase family protein [Thermoleophilaceae bacterium]